ncbi:uncharacterized protein LOC124810826 [Hydra vulgaris]|uniref:uncharacterized protein LOC124810826 n=1 Tax=Hydra vulgaris TaxID=6087 RepID=UPI0001926D14|nr:uncharacterized protein LOC124810826 [Hydra vulgaris]
MNLFAIMILLVSVELIKTQGPRFGPNGIKEMNINPEHFNECINCIDDKAMLLINTRLKEYEHSNKTSCDISQSNLKEWCIQRLKIILNETDSVCKIYPVECECLKSCHRIK